MTLPILLFFIFAGIAVGGALALILAREPIHSALALILVMVALAVLYLLMGAEFISAVQIIVYAGAIMVLFVFVIMLLNAGIESRTQHSVMARWIGIPLSVFLIGDLAYWMARGANSLPLAERSSSLAGGPVSTRDLSLHLFQSYLFPFEITSILILIAVLGAVVLARREP
jgi:NADH-quinone oxidoreductase subunit J